MELPRRPRDDVFVPDGGFRQAVEALRGARRAHGWSIVLAYAFDQRTRLMPFRWVDRRIVPCGVRSIAATLRECGFSQTRIVLQQWTPRFSPSATVRAGFPIDLLLVSSMGLHADGAYRLVHDAHSLREQRPLILMGGPKAIYEPEDCFGVGEQIGDGVDVACTGEEYVLLEFLRLLADEALPGEHPLRAFQRLRSREALNEVPGLVYRAPENGDRSIFRNDASFAKQATGRKMDLSPVSAKPFLLHTGVQRLVRDLDELPMPLDGLRCIEPAHRRRVLQREPWSLEKVRKKAFVASLVSTHGCRFNCDFCPIPAYQQRTWRHKSPERLTAEIRQLAETMNYRVFFGTDDNFFNDRGSVEAILSAMAKGTVHGRSFREKVHFATEATEFDVFKNRDLLPLAAEAGLKTIFFGIEDLNAKLINKGQTVNKTQELFAELRRNEIAPYAMMIHHDDQPLWSTQPDQLGVVNQALRLFNMGAAGYHTTYITPSMGARNVETMFGEGHVLAEIGGRKLPEAFYDGNHVIASRHRHAWVRQMQLWAAYLSFYNPVNFARTLFKNLRDRNNRRRFKWQLVGGSMLVPSILKALPFTLSLALRRKTEHPTMPPRCLPMLDAVSRERVKWGIDSNVSDEPDVVPLTLPDPAEAQVA